MAVSRIAVLGWGSLLWDLDDLAAHVRGDWLMGGGPRLPMEFSRVSRKRKDALVVCLDAEHGAECVTHVIASERTGLAEAAEDLAARERAPLRRIGYATADGRSFGRLQGVCDAVSAWCAVNEWAGAVWTDLEPNFRDATGEDFNIGAAMAYLRTLRGKTLVEAHQYISNAPQATKTPLRTALGADPWWQGLGNSV